MFMGIKTKYILLLATTLLFAVSGLSSCAVPDPGGDGGGEEQDIKTGYFSFRFDAGSVTRAGTRAEEVGGDPERHIDQVYLLLYNGDGNLKYAWDLKAVNFDTGLKNFEGEDVVEDNNPTPGRFTSIARQVSNERYQLVVIANPGSYRDPSIFGINPDIDNLSLVIGTLPELSGSIYRNLTALRAFADGVSPSTFGADYETAGGNKFFMSNANGPVPVSLTSIKGTKTEAESNPVPIAIDRVLAKILVNQGPDVKVTDGISADKIGEVKEFKWVLRQWNTRTYLMRHFAPIADHCPDPTYAGKMETYESGLLVGREYLYATDPNMNSGNTFGGEVQTPPNTADNGRPWNSYAGTIVEDSYAYSTENTMDPDAQGTGSFTYNGIEWNAYTTHIWARVKLRIYEFGSADNFWSFNAGTVENPEWVMCSWAQAKQWWDEDSFPHNMTRLKTLLELAQASADPFTKVFDMSSSTERELQEGDTDYYKSLYEPVSRSFAPMDDFPLVYHRDGICNYRIPITHFNQNGEGLDDYGYYGVVRNNVYKVTVTGVVGPGSTAAKSGHIAADITVNEWFQRDQNNGGLEPYYPN